MPIINGLRPAGAGQTQGSCSPGVRPTLTIEDLGTSKPTSCTEFCVAQIKVHKSCVNLISSTLLSRIIRSILLNIMLHSKFKRLKIKRMQINLMLKKNGNMNWIIWTNINNNVLVFSSLLLLKKFLRIISLLSVMKISFIY